MIIIIPLYVCTNIETSLWLNNQTLNKSFHTEPPSQYQCGVQLWFQMKTHSPWCLLQKDDDHQDWGRDNCHLHLQSEGWSVVSEGATAVWGQPEQGWDAVDPLHAECWRVVSEGTSSIKFRFSRRDVDVYQPPSPWETDWWSARMWNQSSSFLLLLLYFYQLQLQ